MDHQDLMDHPSRADLVLVIQVSLRQASRPGLALHFDPAHPDRALLDLDQAGLNPASLPGLVGLLVPAVRVDRLDQEVCCFVSLIDLIKAALIAVRSAAAHSTWVAVVVWVFRFACP